MDITLTFEEHLKNVFNKTNKTIGLLRKLKNAKIESIQYNACLAITPVIQGTSREKNLPRVRPRVPPTSLLLLVHKTLSLKVFKNEHPKYLFHLIPVRCTPYATRTEGNIPLIKTKHIFFKNSFFPSAIIEWNNLDPNLLETLRVFQSLRKKYLISYNLPQILFLIFTILKELNLLQDLDSV